MAHADLNYYACFGCNITNDVKAYNHATGISLVNPGGGADPYLEVGDGLAGSSRLAHTMEPQSGDTYHLFLIKFYMPAATMDAGDDIRILTALSLSTGSTASLHIHCVQSSGSSFTMKVQEGGTARITGTTAYAADTVHTFILEMDGTDWRLHYWNGSAWEQEGSAAVTTKLRTTGTDVVSINTTGANLGVGEVFRLYHGLLCGTTNRDAAPNATDDHVQADPDGDGTYDGYGANGTCTGTGGTYLEWDDLTSGANDGDTSFNCEQSTEAGAQTSTMSNPTVPTGFFGVMARALARANVASKTVSTWFRLTDATTDVDRENRTIASDSYEMFSHGFRRAPDGSAWTQTLWNGTELGVKSIGSNGAHDYWTALAVELCGVGNAALPAVVPAAARLSTAGVALGSAQTGIY